MIELLKEIERKRKESITRTIFEEFAKRTEENFNRVWSSIAELTEAQKKTEPELASLTTTVKNAEGDGGLSNTIVMNLKTAFILY